ncbi:MAG TPA: dihydropyrimidinase [Anaerolineae bacterium]|nr:dihydropyrimidinase [Anaerolineae bacterium]
MDITIRNGTVVTPSGSYPGDVGVVGERIAAVGKELRGGTELDVTGCYVLPGAIDPHVHLQMPAGAYVSADDFGSGTVAAACGGTTTVIDFVEPAPAEPFLDALTARRALADGRVAVDYGLHMTIPAWHAADRDALAMLPKVVAAGASSFKLYQAYGDLLLNDGLLYAALGAVVACGGLPIIHSENGPLCERLRADAVAAGHTAPRYHALTRPPRQEAEAVGRAVDIAALAGSPLYIVHVSCAEAAARIAAARARGELVYGETCPQYLTLTADALDGPDGERFVCAPPLRRESDRIALWRALSGGELDVVATDHCPFTTEEKSGHADFTSIPGGLGAIEARLSLVHTLGVRGGCITRERWVETCCTAPARLFGLTRKGHVMPGFDADLVVFDPQAKIVLGVDTLHERVDWTPYEGLQLCGWPRHVLSRGKIIVRDGEFVGEPGWGRFVPRERRA